MISRYNILKVSILAVILISGCTETKPPTRPASYTQYDVLIINIDTLRADHTTFHGYFRNTTPNLLALSTESVVFDRAYSPAPWTKPSVASLFTSLYIIQHKTLMGPGNEQDGPKAADILSERLKTFAEVFQDNGYETVGYLDNYLLHEDYGFSQGFEEYDSACGGRRKLTSKYLGYLNNRSINGQSGKLLTYLHYLDVHYPYYSKWNWTDTCNLTIENVTLDVHTAEGHEYFKLKTAVENAKDFDPQEHDITCLVLGYDADLRGMDRSIGDILEYMKKTGTYNKTIIIITADHGEEFFDHGELFHAQSLYRELLHIPLIIRIPGQKPQRITQPVSQIDLIPTLYDVLGLSVDMDYELSGKSLLPLMGYGGEYNRDRIFAENSKNNDWQTIIWGDWKLIKKGDPVRLYNIALDPNETKDVSDEYPSEKERLNKSLSEFHRNTPRIIGRSEKAQIDEEAMLKLRGLGYVST